MVKNPIVLFPVHQLKALYKKSLYYKVNPESGEIDHGVPPTFKIKIPYG